MDISGKKNVNSIFAAAVFLLLAILIFIPAGIFFTGDRSRPGKMKSESTQEMIIAANAIHEGYEKAVSLQSSGDLFNKRGSIEGFDFDRVYTVSLDDASGEYAIRISTHAPGNLIIEVKIKTAKGDLFGLARYYREASAAGPLWGEAVNLHNNVEVHWGPVYGSRRINAGWSVYPRKISGGDVVNRDPNGIDWPNTDSYEWWSYQRLGELPAVDLKYVLQEAKKENLYFRENNIVLSDAADDAPKNRFFENNLKITGRFFMKGIIVVKGNLELNGSAAGSMTVAVPYKAWREYSLLDTAAQGEYPGDLGYQINSQAYEFGGGNNLSINGFLYVKGDVKVTGQHNLYGACVVDGDIYGRGKLNIFYDESLEIPVESKILFQYDEKVFEPVWQDN